MGDAFRKLPPGKCWRAAWGIQADFGEGCVMRWYFPEHGDRRTESYFALFPVRIGREVRWLEKVRVMTVWCSNEGRWVEIEFLD